MQKRIWAVLALVVASALSGSPKVWAQSGITNQNGRQVTCASDDGRRHLCRVDTSRGVQMVNQRSGSPCVQGQTWGYDRSGIWVDRGCRADFLLMRGGNNGGPGWGGGGQPGTALTCSSQNGRRNNCPADTSRGVQLTKQLSGSPCIQGQTWGYDRSGIWVDRGCRANFLLAVNGNNQPGAIITCSSDNGRRNNCPANTSRGVRLRNQRSASPCIQGQTWGYDRSGIWVDRGCRAEFDTTGR